MSNSDLLDVFKILGSHIKLSIIEALGPDKKLAFKELMESIGGGVYSSLLSNHLRALKEHGYIEQDKDGKYLLTDRGLALYNIVTHAKNSLLAYYGLHVITRDLLSYTPERYLASLLPKLLSPPVPHTKHQKLTAKIIERITTEELDTIIEDRLLLYVFSEALKMGLIPDIPFSARVEYRATEKTENPLEYVEKKIRNFTFSSIRKHNLITIFKENSFFTKLYPHGFLQIHLIDPDPSTLISISKKHVFYGSLVVEYNRKLTTEEINLLSLLDSFIPLTVLVDTLDNINVKDILKQDFFHTLFVVKTHTRDKDSIKNTTLLVNKGNAILFSRSSIIPSIMHFAIQKGEPEYLVSTLSVLLPVLYSNVNGRLRAEEYIDLICEDIVEKMLWVRGGIFDKVKRLSGVLGLRNARPSIQISFVGLEALFIGFNPYIDIVRDEKSVDYSAQYLSERASKFLSNNFCKDKAEKYGFFAYTTFFAPYHPYNRASSALQVPNRVPLHYHVNMYSATSFNIGSLETYLKREAKLQSVSPGSSLSIAEIKLGARTSVFEIEDILRDITRLNIITYTLSLSGLSRCSTCRYTTPNLRDICPRCYSREISKLYRPLLAYMDASSPLLDRYIIDEYSSRPVFTGRRSMKPYQAPHL